MQKDAKSSASAQSASDNGTAPVSHANRLRKTTVLRGYRSFDRVLSGGRSISAPPLRLFYRNRSGQPPGMVVGFAVSRSIRSAVKRNRVRRLMREAFRRTQNARSDTPDGRSLEAVWMYTGTSADIPRLAAIEDAMRTLTMKMLARTP